MAQLIELPGADGPINEGERRVVEALVRELPSDYYVIPNIEITEASGQAFEYDVVVSAPHAVYAIETKDWRGEIIGDEREWLVNGATRKSPLPAVQRKARILKSKLVDRMQVLAQLWVEPAVVLASQPVSLELTDEALRLVFSIPELVVYLTSPARLGPRADTSGELQEHALRALTSQAHRRTGMPVFGTYLVIEELSQSGDETEYRARHRQLPGVPPVHLRVVFLSAYGLTEQQRAERKTILARDAEALLIMGSHPNVIAAREFFETDAGQFVLVLDEVPGRSLSQRLKNGTPMSTSERLGLLAEITRALAHAHTHGVIHRQLSPECILIGDDGSARLANFSLAKLLKAVSQRSGTMNRSMTSIQPIWPRSWRIPGWAN